MENQIQLIPVQGTPLDPPKPLSYLEAIIDKKVNNVALSCFETIVHWVLTTFSCFYPAYDRLYKEQLSIVKHFSDGTIIKDLTAGKIVSIITERPDLAVNFNTDYIALNNHKVLFIPNGPRLLGKNDYNTDHIVVKNDPADPTFIIITEYQRTGNVKEDIVNTHRLFYRQDTGNVYLTEEAINQCLQNNDWAGFSPPVL